MPPEDLEVYTEKAIADLEKEADAVIVPPLWPKCACCGCCGKGRKRKKDKESSKVTPEWKVDDAT
eukprot:1268876-Prymnesium_polylepis.1